MNSKMNTDPVDTEEANEVSISATQLDLSPNGNAPKRESCCTGLQSENKKKTAMHSCSQNRLFWSYTVNMDDIWHSEKTGSYWFILSHTSYWFILNHTSYWFKLKSILVYRPTSFRFILVRTSYRFVVTLLYFILVNNDFIQTI